MSILNVYRLCFICCFFLCTGHVWSQPQKLYLNPATAGAASQSKFVEITRFIPVDAPSEKISATVSLTITKKYWILYDYMEKKLFFLTPEGKYLQSVDIKLYMDASVIYDNKNELLKLNTRNKNYTLTAKDLVKIRAGYAKKSNQKYFKNYEIDLKAEDLKVKRTPVDPYFITNARWCYDDYYYRSDLAIDPRSKDTAGFELELLQHYQPVQSFFPFNKTRNHIFRYAAMAGNTGMYLSDTDTPYIKYTARPFYSTIYKLNRDSIVPMYEIVLPLENAMPQQYFVNGFKSKAAWNNFQNGHGAVFHSISSIKDIGKYLFFGIRYMRSYESLLYDKSNARFYKTKMIKADSSQYNIQLLQNGPGLYANGHYYAVIPAQTLVDFYNRNREKNTSYPPPLAAFLEKATKSSAPVIVEYKIKN